MLTHEQRRFEPGVRLGSVLEEQLRNVERQQASRRSRQRTIDERLLVPHVDCRVKRGHARRVSNVGIGTLLNQQRGDVIVGVDDRHVERGRAIGIARIEIRARLGQRSHTIARTLSCRQQERGESSFGERRHHHRRGIDFDLGELGDRRSRIQIGATLGQQRNDLSVILGQPTSTPSRLARLRTLTFAPFAMSN